MTLRKTIWTHPWTTVAYNLLLMMALFTIMRLFFYLVNIDIYSGISSRHLLEIMAGGVRFDLTALLYLNSVYMALMLLPLPATWRTNRTYQKTALWLYWVPNIIGILLNAIDTVYVRFSDRRTTVAFFSEFENDDNLAQIFITGMGQYWYVTLFAAAMIAALLLLTRRTGISLPTTDKPLRYYVRETLILCVSVYFIVIGIRGGFGAFTRPITLSNALQYTARPCETNIVLNTPFCLMRSSEGKAYQNPAYYNENELDNLYSPIRFYTADGAQKNVVVFILESFSKEYIGYYNHDLHGGTYTGYTPFLDSLLTYSVTYRNTYATGRKSIDAMPSILSSLPRIGQPYILTPYSTNTVMSIASCLGDEGYETAFFHGAPNGSMGFQAYARGAGFQHYYGKDEYNNDNDYDGYWAIWDEEFLQFYARSMSSMQQPFMTAVFTATSHHPFQVPDRYQDTFPTGDMPIHRCIGYTDHALRRFFNYARTQPWFANTLFVLTADHTNQLMETEYTNDRGVYEVPIIFYDPSWTESNLNKLRTNSTLPVSHVDIMPSVLAYVGYQKPFITFGENILTEQPAHKYTVNYNEPVYQCISDSLFMQFDGTDITHLYDYSADRLLQNDLAAGHAQDSLVQDMLTYTKAYIQQYITRMINNRLTTHGSQN